MDGERGRDVTEGGGTPEQMGAAHRRGCILSFSKLRAVLAADLYRYSGTVSAKAFFKHFLFTPGYKYTVLMRTCGYLKIKPAMAFGLYPVIKMMLLRARYKYGIAIPEYTLIGPGFFINRFGGIYVNGDVVIGCNVNYTHGAMLGQLNRGPRAGNPTLGNRVLLASGAKVIGRISIGDDCSVGANAVVTKDVPASGGSEGYINRAVPAAMLQRCVGAFVGPVPDGFMQPAN